MKTHSGPAQGSHHSHPRRQPHSHLHSPQTPADANLPQQHSRPQGEHSHPHADHSHEHPDYHSEDHADGDDHGHTYASLRGWLAHLFSLHSHHPVGGTLEAALISNERGIRAVKLSLIALLITAAFQVVIVVLSGSVALLADTAHNFSDALTALPIWLAFALARRARNQRYTYGYGRAEDLAGAVVVLMIFLSALVVFWESYEKLVHPAPMQHLGWVAVAAVVGFLGNELVAVFRLRVGREIGSAALVADGLHARADGFTSLGVLLGAIGVWLGFPLADPLVGLAIGIAIVVIVAGAARDMWYRLMDATDPEMWHVIDATARGMPGVLGVHDLRVRWVGHWLNGELHIVVDCRLSTAQGHRIAEEVRHALFHALPALVEVTVHVDPCECEAEPEHHAVTAHHSDAIGAGLIADRAGTDNGHPPLLTA